jgi:type IV pilus assembly protein PilQ
MGHINFYSSAVKWLIIIVAFLLFLPHCSDASGLIYTIQTGSFEDMDHADEQFDTIVSALQGKEIHDLRIEEVGPYFCVRMGTFETYPGAREFLLRSQPPVRDAIVLEAYMKDERIRRSYPEVSSAADNDEETEVPSEPAPGQYPLHDEESMGGEDESDPVMQEADTHNKGKGKPVFLPVDMTEKEDRLSLSIQDADIQSVLKGLSIKKKLNIVASKDVKGNISVNVHDLPLNEVLDAVIAVNGFRYVEKDNVIFVTKGNENSADNLLDEEVRIFKLNFADIVEAEKVAKGLVSESAEITLYQPENTLVIEDISRNLDRVGKVLKALDVPPRQVLIETKILQVRLNDDTSLGIDWGDTFSGFFNSSGTVFTQGFTGGTKGFFFNLMNSDFELFLEALQSITEVNTLSSPSLLALNKMEARIIIGEKLGYYVTTATEATVLQSVEFLDTGTQLILVPHIIDDDRVIMEIHPEISDGIVIDGLPSKNTAEVTTNLMAPNGGTIFIGGLIRDRKEDIKERVPGLGAIPIIGALFSKTTNITTRTEIVVLITPHIITAGNKDLLKQETEKVNHIEEDLKKERSLKELLPGMK